ncbi:hypothetical protein [Vibrio hyugaensis]|uniref:hypothetical protein n=1 Tax=Vibrio hyugaensis TaxID=1534743 RepID=UPI003DA10FD0
MASDYITEHMEEEHREAQFKENMRQAAIHIINGMAESDAITHMENIQWRRDDAEAKNEYIEDENGNIDHYMDAELNTPSSNALNSKQIYAIQQKLLEKYA